MATMPALDIKFQRSKDYTYDRLIRDLIQHVQDLNAKLAELESRIETLEGP